MKNKIIAICITIFFIDLLLLLINRHDSIIEYVPFAEVVLSRHFKVRAYEVFLLISILMCRYLYAHFGINISTIRYIPNYFRPMRIFDYGVFIVSGIIAHAYLWPFIFNIFKEPISVLSQSPDSIRKTVIMTLPLIWILIISILSRTTGAVYSQPQGQAPTMPSPPTW